MTRSLTSAAAACTAALILASAAAAPASAYYLGYGNGDPGNWDFWAEQSSGHTPGTPAHYRTTQHYAPSSHAHSAHHAHHVQKPSAPAGKGY